MKNLETTFNKLLAKFENKKEHFKKIIENWNAKGKADWAKRGKHYLNLAKQNIQELKTIFANQKGTTDKSLVKTKLKNFKKSYKQLNETTKHPIRQWTEAIIVAGLAAFILRSTLFSLYKVPTGSAEPNILIGDYVWSNKLPYLFSKKMNRGECVVYDDMNFTFDKSNKLKFWWQKYVGLSVPFLGIKKGPINVVKRVIGIPGDVVEGKIEDGKPVIYLNDKKLDEPYINPYPLILLKKSTGFIDADHIGPITIPNFLKKTYDKSYYIYDPSKSYADQPWHYIKKSEVVKIPWAPEATFRYPYTPTYKDAEKTQCADLFGPMKVPEGKYWIMGDNRKNSADSRWFGFLDADRIHGRLSFIIASFGGNEAFWVFTLLKHPIDFWTKYARWSRFFTKPKNVAKRN
jgi:signal peptidase I